MNDEFKKLSQGDVTRYVLENASGGGTSSGSVASVSMPMGGMQRRKGDNLIAQEGDKKKVPASTPRNFVAKNAKSSGAGAHKDKKKEAKQGNVKHKKPFMENRDHPDHEIQMASSELMSIAKNAQSLLDMVQRYSEQEGLDAWQQSKITKAADYLNSVLQSINGEQQGVAEDNFGPAATAAIQQGKSPSDVAYADTKDKNNIAKGLKIQQQVAAGDDPTLTNAGNAARRAGNTTVEDEQGVAEGDAGLSKDAETNFHAKLDQLVHATFGKRKSEQGTEEDMSRRGFLKGAGAMAAGISAASGAHADEKSDPNKLIAIVNIDGESKEFNLTGKFKGDVKSQLHQAENFITEFLEKRDINFSNLELRYQGAVLKTQNTGSVRETSQLGELSKDTLKSYIPRRLNKAKDEISTDPDKRNIAKAKRATTQDVPRAMAKYKDPAYGQQSVAEGVPETLPLNDALKALRLNGAIRLETTSDRLNFYKNGQPFSVDLIFNNDATRSVSLSQLNSVIRDLKGQGVAEGAKVDRQAKHITASMMKKGKSKKDAESIAWAHIKHPKNESVDSYMESLDVMLERQLEPTMDLDAWVDNFQNADPQKYHQFKNKTPEKKK